MLRVILVLGSVIVFWMLAFSTGKLLRYQSVPRSIGKPEGMLWKAPGVHMLPDNDSGNFIRYGRDLVINTSYYYGLKGILKPSRNGLNCQSCHLEAGTKPWGNNFGAVAATYPKYRERSGTVESIERKINDCFERSMNGSAIDSSGKEMQAMVAYMKWLGFKLQKGNIPGGAGLKKLPYMQAATDTSFGKVVYSAKCSMCHGSNGEGKWKEDHSGYLYPPLWGAHSYNNGAGIYRISKFAAFVKYNMPFGVNYTTPLLTDEEAWNVAAYVNSQPRPEKDISSDWPDINTKPADHPFGPYADNFSEDQHKYGPFKEIEQLKSRKLPGR